jgi:hypothetical protein
MWLHSGCEHSCVQHAGGLQWLHELASVKSRHLLVLWPDAGLVVSMMSAATPHHLDKAMSESAKCLQAVCCLTCCSSLVADNCPALRTLLLYSAAGTAAGAAVAAQHTSAITVTVLF